MCPTEIFYRDWTKHENSESSQLVRGVSWSEVATVPKRKSRRSLDLSLSWNSEEDIWKGRKKSNGTKRKRRRVKRTNTTQRTIAHAWMGLRGLDRLEPQVRCDTMCINEQRSVCSVLSVVHVHVRDSVYVDHRVWLKIAVDVAIIYAVICSWIWGVGYNPSTPPVGERRLLSAVTDCMITKKKIQILSVRWAAPQ